MSQVKCHSIYLDKEVEVMAGWDRPLSSYHLTVFDMNPKDDESDVIYCQLEHFELFSPTEIAPLVGVLDKMGIVVPMDFWEYASRKEGNVTYTHRNGEWERNSF